MKLIPLILALALVLSGCASKQAQQQRAYEKYVQKSSATRVKQRSLFHNGKPGMPTAPMPSEPVESTATGPESASSDQ